MIDKSTLILDYRRFFDLLDIVGKNFAVNIIYKDLVFLEVVVDCPKDKSDM